MEQSHCPWPLNNKSTLSQICLPPSQRRRFRPLFLMTDPLRSAASKSAMQSPENDTEVVDSDFVVILAALLCALICVLGLVAVARCAWLRRFFGAAAASQASANKGLKKKVLRSLPKLSYSAEKHAGHLVDCAVCLAEFSSGDEIRVLPRCGHGFHVGCIDTWLGSHSSCPSCRQILVAPRCRRCGGLPDNSAADVGADRTDAEAGTTVTEARMDSFLP
ncbi:hypothetical protein Nepgr_006537 [Nepenthes gracilis]|uniref:RING-type E3 ubiquitin transferase n=1 Tax=Nepenthes gracilis TaxID=150966 RepID=A0AAD3S5Z4_NEPGR|nr:hypothetical protein Nepgr_006537 [Nepenthes gracilis]